MTGPSGLETGRMRESVGAAVAAPADLDGIGGCFPLAQRQLRGTGGCFGGGCRMAAEYDQDDSSEGSECASSAHDGSGGAAAAACGDPEAPSSGACGVERTAHTATTRDGWRLHLHRVRCAAAAARRARRLPVVLCPGLGSGGIESFDLDASVSLAQHLAEHGFDVWVPDLRGNGRSDQPKWWDRKTWWTVDDHLHLDFPAVVDAVLALSGAPQLHWLGHSMGGMLAVGALCRGLPAAAALRTVTTLGSGCFGAGSWHALAGAWVARLTAIGFHGGAVVPLVTSLRGPLAPLAWAVQSLFYVHANVRPETGRKLLGSVLSFIPAGLVKQFVGSLNGPLGMSSCDGSWQYADPKALAHVTTPVFAINGDKDLFCPAAGAFKTIHLFGGPHRRFLFLGPAYGTTRHHYGHFCPIIGRHIKTEVFPHIEAFMAEFDSADTADTAAMIATKHKFGCAAAAPGNSAPGPPQRLPPMPAAVQAIGAKDCA